MANKQSHLKARFSLDDSMFQKGLSGIRAGVARAKSVIMGVGVISLAAAASVAAVSAALSSPVSRAASFEDAIVGFEQLLGGAEAARQRVEELTTFAATTPFEFPGVMAASRTLETLTKGALSTGAGLRMVGDAAAAVDQPIEDLAMWFGRLYDGIQSGRPVGEAMMRLQELGLMSGDVRNQLETMQKTGKRGAEVWAVVAQSMERFSGLMERRSGTWNGKMSNLSDAWGQLLAKIGAPLKDSLSPFLDGIIAVVNGLVGQGVGFGTQLVKAGQDFFSWIMAIVGAFSSFGNFFKLWGAILKLEFLEGLVILRDGFNKAIEFFTSALASVMGTGLLTLLSEVAKTFGQLLGGAAMSVVPRLWDGLKTVIAAMTAGFKVATASVIELFIRGIMATVDWFSQGWTKAIWDPLKSFGSYLAEMAMRFGTAIKNFLTGAWGEGKKAAEELGEKAGELTVKAQARLSEGPPLTERIADFMVKFKAPNFKDAFQDSRQRMDASDPLQPFMEQMKAAGDKMLPEALEKLKKLGMENLVEPVAKFFHADKSLTGARDAAFADFRKVIADLAPVGKKAVVDAVGVMFPNAKQPLIPVSHLAKSFSLGDANPLTDWRRAQGLTVTGLKTGSLTSPQVKKAKEESAQPDVQVDIKKTLIELLNLNKEVWKAS